MATLSAAVLTYNSERTLPMVLEGLEFCDEIIAVDSGSTDETLEILKANPKVKVFHRKLDAFGPQKAYAIDQCQSDWVVIIDSDEVLGSVAQREIKDFIHRPGTFLAARLKQDLIFLGKILKFSGVQKTHSVRLFKRGRVHMNASFVHERLNVDEKYVALLQEPAMHYSYLSISDYVQKFNHYTTLSAKEALTQGKKSSLFKIIFSAPFTFFKFYFLRLGFLDGLHGWIWCTFSSFYPLVKQLKMKEFEKKVVRE